MRNRHRVGVIRRRQRSRLIFMRDGWRRVCAEFQVDPELLLNDVPAYDTVKRSEEAARLVAFSVEEARAWLRKTSTATEEVVTAEAEAAAIWGFVNSREQWWG